MSRLGIGLYSLAGVYGQKDLAEVRRMLWQAVERGVTFFDVADQYGPAEEVLGSTLHSARFRIEISTKVGLTEGGGRDCSRQHILEACHRSLQRLRTDYLDYYQIHFDDPDTPIEETVEALEILHRQGLIRRYTIGHLPLKRIKEYAVKGHPAAVMMELSPVALRQYLYGLPLCAEHDLQIIAMGTAARGLLTGRISENRNFPQNDLRRIDPLFSHSLRQSAFRILRKLEEIGDAYHKSPIQVTLNWIMQLDRVDIVLTGPSTMAHLEENLGALDWKLAPADLEELDQSIQTEETWKDEELRKDIRHILTSGLDGEQERVVADLIYVVSALLDLELADESDLLPLFHKIMSWRKQGFYPEELKMAREILDPWIYRL